MTTTRIAAFAAAALLVPSLAIAGLSVGDSLGVTDQEIRDKLKAAGYTVHEIEREHGEIEVEASSKEGYFEIEIAPDTGAIVEVELEEPDEETSDLRDDG